MFLLVLSLTYPQRDGGLSQPPARMSQEWVLNPGPVAWRSAALPTELSQPIELCWCLVWVNCCCRQTKSSQYVKWWCLFSEFSSGNIVVFFGLWLNGQLCLCSWATLSPCIVVFGSVVMSALHCWSHYSWEPVPIWHIYWHSLPINAPWVILYVAYCWHLKDIFGNSMVNKYFTAMNSIVGSLSRLQ